MKVHRIENKGFIRSCGTADSPPSPLYANVYHNFAPLCSIPAGRPRLIATVIDPQDLANFFGKIVCEGEKVYLYLPGAA